MSQATLCQAIQTKNVVQFYYDGGLRTVEPHMVAYNQAGNLALSAWFLSGHSKSGEGAGWREYLLSDISSITILSQTFSGPRAGYKSDGGQKFSNIQCSI